MTRPKKHRRLRLDPQPRKGKEPKNLGRVHGHNCDPIEHACHDQVTHVCWGEDGPQLVHRGAKGYAKEDLVRLPRGYSEQTHEADHANRTFVRRTTPLGPEPTAEDLLRLKVEVLERQVTDLLAGQATAREGL